MLLYKDRSVQLPKANRMLYGIQAEMFNQSTWQRVWAAKSVNAMRRGFMLGSFLVFLLIMFFGIMGMIAYGK